MTIDENEADLPFSESNLDKYFREENEAQEAVERIKIAEMKYYFGENQFDLILEGGNSNSPTFEEMEEYFSQIIKEKYNGTYIPDETNNTYRMEHSFNDFLSEVSADTFRAQMKSTRQDRMKRKQERETRQKHKESLKDIGYQETRSQETGENLGYEKRLLDVLENNNIKNIPSIISQTTDIKIIDKKPDFYETNLITKLEAYEKEIETSYIVDEKLQEIEKIFCSGHIDNPLLFFRFETLKKNNLIQVQKRIFHFGLLKDDIHGLFETNKSGEYSEYLKDNDVEILSHFFKYRGSSYEQLGIPREIFIEKLKKGFIETRIKKRVEGGRFGTKYSGFYSKNLERSFEVDQKKQHQRLNEAKKKFMLQYPALIETQSFDHITIFLKEITENRNNILKRKEEFSDNTFDIAKEKEKIIFGLENCIRQGIEKLKNKEKIMNCKREQRKNLSYKEQLNNIIIQIEILYKELKTIEPETDDSQRQTKKEEYKNEYIDFHRNNFIQKRIAGVLKGEINTEEGLKEQIIKDVSLHFEKTCKKEIEKKATHPVTFNPLTKRKAITFLTDSFFRTGHALLLKTKYPDDQQRKILREELIQTITKNLLIKTEQNLSGEGFSEIDNCLIEPLIYLYEKYNGKEKNLMKNSDKIKNNHYNFLKNQLFNDIALSIRQIEKHLQKPISREQIKNTYIAINSCITYLSKYLDFFLKDHRKILEEKRQKETQKNGIYVLHFLEENKTYNEQHQYKYPEIYMQKLALYGYDIQDIEKLVDADIQEKFIHMFQKIEEINPQICEKIIQQWLQENGQAGGKLQRIIQEAIIKEFGTTTIGGPQIEYIITYLGDHLESIFFKDLEIEIIPDFNPFRHNKEILQSMIRSFLQNFQQHLALNQGKNTNFLEA